MNNTFKNFYIVVSKEENGAEYIYFFNDYENNIKRPLIVSDESMLEDVKNIMESIHESTKKHLQLLKFSNKEIIKEIR